MAMPGPLYTAETSCFHGFTIVTYFPHRFLTIDYKEEYYTKEGLEWVEKSTMKKVLLRNFPEVPGLDSAMKKVSNAFYVWSK